MSPSARCTRLWLAVRCALACALMPDAGACADALACSACLCVPGVLAMAMGLGPYPGVRYFKPTRTPPVPQLDFFLWSRVELELELELLSAVLIY